MDLRRSSIPKEKFFLSFFLFSIPRISHSSLLSKSGRLFSPPRPLETSSKTEELSLHLLCSFSFSSLASALFRPGTSATLTAGTTGKRKIHTLGKQVIGGRPKRERGNPLSAHTSAKEFEEDSSLIIENDRRVPYPN